MTSSFLRLSEVSQGWIENIPESEKNIALIIIGLAVLVVFLLIYRRSLARLKARMVERAARNQSKKDHQREIHLVMEVGDVPGIVFSVQ